MHQSVARLAVCTKDSKREQTGACHLTTGKMGAKPKTKRSKEALRIQKILFQRPQEQNKNTSKQSTQTKT